MFDRQQNFIFMIELLVNKKLLVGLANVFAALPGAALPPATLSHQPTLNGTNETFVKDHKDIKTCSFVIVLKYIIVNEKT